MTSASDRSRLALDLLRRGAAAPGRLGVLGKAWRYAVGRTREAARRRSDVRLDSTFTRRRIAGIIVEVPPFRGTFEVRATSLLARSLRAGDFESEAPALVEILMTPGADAVDVGANIGCFSVLLASLCRPGGRVLAIEPSPSILPMLERNLRRNLAPEVLVHEGALAEAGGARTLHLVDASPEYSSLGAIVHPHAPRAVRDVCVTTSTLDDLVAHHGLQPTFVKIDVEGAEALVLDGARDSLRRHRPAILTEVDDRLLATLGSTAAGVFQRLEMLDYRVFDVRDGLPPRPSAGAPFIGAVLALPGEHLAESVP